MIYNGVASEYEIPTQNKNIEHTITINDESKIANCRLEKELYKYKWLYDNALRTMTSLEPHKCYDYWKDYLEESFEFYMNWRNNLQK